MLLSVHEAVGSAAGTNYASLKTKQINNTLDSVPFFPRGPELLACANEVARLSAVFAYGVKKKTKNAIT
jgi:hypothetical protein